MYRPLALTSYKTFLKNKKRSGSSQSPNLIPCMILEKIYFTRHAIFY